MNPRFGRDEQVAELQRKLEEYLHLQEHVVQQQVAIESAHLLTNEALAAANKKLKSTQIQLEAALVRLKNAGARPTETNPDEKDVIIAQQQQQIDDLKATVAQLEKDKAILQSQNEDKSALIVMYKKEIGRLQSRLEKAEKDTKADGNIFYAEVFKALNKNGCRKNCVENLRRLVTKETCNDAIVQDFRALRYQGKAASDAATEFLTNNKNLQEFTPDQNKVFTEIRGRVSDASLDAIKAVLDEVGDIKDEAGVQDDFYGIQKNDGNPNWSRNAAEDFLEQHPNYLVPLTARANGVLTEVKRRVNLQNYNRLKSDITSNQRGTRNQNRVLFYRFVAEGRGLAATARKFIKESDAEFDGFWAKYF